MIKIKNSTSIIPKLLGIFLVTGIALFVVYSSQVSTASEDFRGHGSKLQDNYQALRDKLENYWMEADYDPKVCPEHMYSEKLVHFDFYKCNPVLFKCFLKKKKQQLIGKKVFKFKKIKFDKRLRPIVSFKSGKDNFTFRFSYACTDVFLPQNYYSSGEKGKNFLFDTFNQFVYIDKNYISNLMVNLWSGSQIKQPYEPNTSLNLKEKKAFCATLGKQLLESRYLDAASFYPDLKVSSKIRYFYKHPYPWSKAAKRNKRKINSSDCSNIYSKECESIRPYQFQEPLSVTWIGIQNALGNYPEIVENKFQKKFNLVPSSFFFDWNDKRHQVGLREKANQNNIFKKGAFRCMSVY